MTHRRGAWRGLLVGCAVTSALGGCTAPGADVPVAHVRPTIDLDAATARQGRRSLPPAPPSDQLSADAPFTEEGLAEALRTAPPGPPRSNAEMLEQYWESNRLEGEPPRVAPVRTVSLEEADLVNLRCMAEQGFPSRLDQRGQEGTPFEAGHEDDLRRAEYVCLAMYPLDEKYLRPFSLHQLRQLYDWRVMETVPCMRADGVDVPEPPSFETFAGEYAATGYRHWSPRSEVELPEEIVTAPDFMDWCPDTPPDDVLYGD